MKRQLIILAGIIILLIAVSLLCFDQSRKFYCVGEGKCVTVWKRLGNKCYIIPGKYYGIIKPSDNYIETTNSQYLTIYFSDKMHRTLIIRSQGTDNGEDGYVIKNNDREAVALISYADKYHAILYKPKAVRHIDVNSDAYLLDIDIKESYATDKNGEKLK